MKKHIEKVEQSTFLKEYIKDGGNQHRGPLDCEPTNKWPHVFPNVIIGFSLKQK
jgi:hypothetical protein